MEIVEMDINTIKKLPKYYELIYNTYGLNEVSIYYFEDEGISGFFCNDGRICLYLDKYIFKIFQTDDDYNLIAYNGDRYQVFYGDNVSFKDKKGIQYKIDLAKLDNDEAINGKLYYTIYYPDKDMLCQFSYPYRYNERNGKPLLFSVDKESYESVYIEEDYFKKKFNGGFLPKRIKAFNRVTYDADMIGYDLVTINEHGLLSLLGNSNIEEGNRITRFVKSFYVGKDGVFKDFGLLGRLYKKEEIDELLDSYDIDNKIDDELIKLYNKNDYAIYRIESILNRFKMDKSKENLGISLTLKEK